MVVLVATFSFKAPRKMIRRLEYKRVTVSKLELGFFINGRRVSENLFGLSRRHVRHL